MFTMGSAFTRSCIMVCIPMGLHTNGLYTNTFPPVVKRSGQFLKTTGDKFNGQLPHHFEGTNPTFTALSGATQTGPNTFWTKTALQYAKVSTTVHQGSHRSLHSFPFLHVAHSLCATFFLVLFLLAPSHHTHTLTLPPHTFSHPPTTHILSHSHHRPQVT
jgi:hypothetical protein